MNVSFVIAVRRWMRGPSIERSCPNERPALVDDHRIPGVELRLPRFELGAETLRAVLRRVAEVARRRVVPPADAVVRHAVDDGVAEHRGAQARDDQPLEV